MASRQREFVNRVYNQAREAGLPDAQARLAASQAALESNYGQNTVGNNYFGIKAGSSWNGPSVTAGTWEDYGNGPVKERAAFRSYDNPLDSFRDWSSTVGRRWAGALSAPTLSEAVENLRYGQPGGYATDRSYGNKIRSIDRKYGPSSMEVGFDVPQGNIPTPTSAPDIQGILNQAHPQNSLLSNVERSALPDLPGTSMAAFDKGRFGPKTNMQTVPELSYDRFATTPFDQSRFGTPEPAVTGKNALRRGLLDQQLDAGILPDLSNPAYAAMTPPSVQRTAPTTVAAPADVQAPTMRNALLSPNEQQAVAAQRAYLTSQPFNRQSPFTSQNFTKALGSIGGALLGGFTLGPAGALIGGLAGNKLLDMATPAENKFPDRPKNRSQGDGSLTNYGRSVANQSGQFSRAVSSGKAGLW